jgi:hypothetical protein
VEEAMAENLARVSGAAWQIDGEWGKDGRLKPVLEKADAGWFT